MKLKLAASSIFILLALYGVFSSYLPDIAAQSGRITPKPTSPPETLKSLEDQQPDRKASAAEIYKVAFVRSYPDEAIFADPPKDKEEERARRKIVNMRYHERKQDAKEAGYLVQLNLAGAQSYRFVAESYGIAILKQAAHPYEYTQFTTPKFKEYITDGGLFEKGYMPFAQQGFSLLKPFTQWTSCSQTDNGTSYPDESCSHKFGFLLERPTGVTTPRQYRLIKARDELLRATLDAGFFPTHAFSSDDIFCQQSILPDTDWINVAELKIVTLKTNLFSMLKLWDFTSVEQKVIENAQQGYRLYLAHSNLTLMRHLPQETTPTHYLWIPEIGLTSDRIARLKQVNAKYRIRHQTSDFRESAFIFEPQEPYQTLYSYKLIKLELQKTELAAQKRVELDLTPASKEALVTINQLAQEGYVVRDVFSPRTLAEGCYVLLEGVFKPTKGK